MFTQFGIQPPSSKSTSVNTLAAADNSRASMPIDGLNMTLKKCIYISNLKLIILFGLLFLLSRCVVKTFVCTNFCRVRLFRNACTAKF